MVDLIEVEDDESKSWKTKEPGPLKDIVDAGGKPAGGTPFPYPCLPRILQSRWLLRKLFPLAPSVRQQAFFQQPALFRKSGKVLLHQHVQN